jgi:hypothetical protein
VLYFVDPGFFLFGKKGVFSYDAARRVMHTGDRQECYETPTAVNTFEHWVDTDTEWFTEADSDAADILIVAKAHYLVARDSADPNITISLSETSDFAVAGSFSKDYNKNDLIGRERQDLVEIFAPAIPRRYWRFTSTTTKEVKHKFSKIYLSKRFYIGREPVVGSQIIYQESPQQGHRIEPRYLQLNYQGIGMTAYKYLRERILQFKATNPIFLWASDDNSLLGTERLFHGTITTARAMARSVDKYDLELTLREEI